VDKNFCLDHAFAALRRTDALILSFDRPSPINLVIQSGDCVVGMGGAKNPDTDAGIVLITSSSRRALHLPRDPSLAHFS
jgi:hypothetical protein